MNINATDPKDGMNALLKFSRFYGHDNLIELFQPLIFDRGIEVNATDLDGWNALHNLCRFYVHNNLIELIQLLHASNIDFEAKTKEKSVELYHSALKTNPAMINNVDKIATILNKEGSLFEVIVKVIQLIFLPSTKLKSLNLKVFISKM